MNGEHVNQLGFWCQLVVLALLDWGSIHAFLKEDSPWYHWAGLIAMNLVLLSLALVMWRWLRDQSSKDMDAIFSPPSDLKG